MFKFASRRLGWHGTNPILGLENGERPKVGQTIRRRIFEGDELAQTLAAAREPWRTLFSLAAVTGARLSELLGLVWSDLDLSDADAATVTFQFQVDREGNRQELKTEESQRTVELPRQLARMLLEHRARSLNSVDDDFVFSTRTGRAISQRNVTRALRATMKRARTAEGKPTFPALQDDGGKVERGTVPVFHSLRHSAASEAIAAGEGAEQVSWQLGHRNSVVTRSIYIRELKSAERQAQRRATMEARYGPMLSGSAMEAADGSKGPQTANPDGAEIVELQAANGKRQ